MISRKRETIHRAGRTAALATGRQKRFGILGLLLAAGIALLPLITTRGAAQEAAPSYSVLYNFTGGADGANPSSVIRDEGGNLYGTTFVGGLSGCGVVFKLDPSGKETVLYTFTCGADGGFPPAGLIRDAAGNLYGTTSSGGNTSATNCVPSGCGVVFKLDSSGQETVLYAFSGGPDGNIPQASLIRDAAGNLYGTTFYGGNTSS